MRCGIPVGYTAGYLMLLLFVAAPLRRSGAYTIPDFTEARLDSRAVRRVTSLVVVLVGWLYIVPQLQGAALAIRITTGLPAWVGPVAVVAVVCITVVAGGMRSITFVQAFQYWLKLTALAVPIVFLLLCAGRQRARPRRRPASRTRRRWPPRAPTRPFRCWWRCSLARSGCRTCWCGSTPIPTGSPPAGRP